MRIILLILLIGIQDYTFCAPEVSGSVKIITGTEAANIKENSLWNPGNNIFEFYERNLLLDLRPSIEIKPNSISSLTLRPRMEAKYGTYQTSQDDHTKGKEDFWLDEGFVTLRPMEILQLHIGRQNFLWGPSEITSPSNPFYPDLLSRPYPLYQLRGITLARANINVHDRVNIILMAELEALDDSSFEMRAPEKDDNKKRMLLKPEYNSASGDMVLGLSLGKNSKVSNFYGGYAMWTINSAIQLYSDLRIERATSSSHPFYVAGVRWTFKDGTEWRNEYIYKELGYKESEIAQLSLLMQNPSIANSININQKNNPDTLLSEKYYYSSLRFTLNDNSYIERPILGLRSLYSLNTDSGIASLFFEAGINDRTTLTTYVAQSYGPTLGELNQLVNTAGGIYFQFDY